MIFFFWIQLQCNKSHLKPQLAEQITASLRALFVLWASMHHHHAQIENDWSIACQDCAMQLAIIIHHHHHHYCSAYHCFNAMQCTKPSSPLSPLLHNPMQWCTKLPPSQKNTFHQTLVKLLLLRTFIPSHRSANGAVNRAKYCKNAKKNTTSWKWGKHRPKPKWIFHTQVWQLSLLGSR